MTLAEYELTENNHFVAMEYYGLILNRTFLIIIDKDFLIGIKANGLVATEGGPNTLARYITRQLAVTGDLTNPRSYVKSKIMRKVENVDLLGADFLRMRDGNFRIPLSDIQEVYFNPNRKWGMGYYSHDGRVYVVTSKKKKREFIILGQQSGDMICRRIKALLPTAAI